MEMIWSIRGTRSLGHGKEENVCHSVSDLILLILIVSQQPGSCVPLLILRVGDAQQISYITIAKSWIYTDLLIKPEEVVLYKINLGRRGDSASLT